MQTSSPIMQNDFTEGAPPLQSSEVDQISALSRLQVNRFEAELWAVKDCTFLIFDDLGSDQLKGANRHTAKIDEDFCCNICSALPEFPHKRKTREFRLFRPKIKDLNADSSSPSSAASVCGHYVAISYCWPTTDGSAQVDGRGSGHSYHVRELDGRVRSNRAPDDVIDRAVDVANSCGLRMIWIDQECLPQPDNTSEQRLKDEQQLGLQAMDIIYHRAVVIAGLHDLQISDQRLLDFIQSAGAPDTSPEVNGVLSFGAVDLLVIDFLEAVSNDKWYKRAWIIQEALSAGECLALVFKRVKGVSYPSKFRFPKSALKSPAHSLDSRPRGMPSEVVCVSVVAFRRLVSKLQAFFQALSAGNIWGTLILSRLVDRNVEKILATAAALHPASTSTRSIWTKVQVQSLYNYRARCVVDAASALSLLKTRSCRDVQDLIAIMANMCGYEIRLHTNDVARQCKSLRVALLTLALINGDNSLLVPELYSIPDNYTQRAQRETVGWLHPFGDFATLVDHSGSHRSEDPRLILPHYMWNGPLVPAYLWKVRDQLDLSPVKDRWKRTWVGLQRLRLIIDRKKDETDAQLSARKVSLSNHFSQSEIIYRAKEELFGSDEIAEGSSIWDGIDKAGLRITSYLDANRLEFNPVGQNQIAMMFFDILRLLFAQSQSDHRALCVANSIWQSVRVDAICNQTGAEDEPYVSNDELPDTVSEALFKHPDVITRPFKALQLDRLRDGQYAQAWLLYRVMTKGSIWIGSYQRPTPLPKHLDDSLRLARERFDAQIVNSWASLERQASGASILKRQLERQIMATLAKGGNLEFFEKRGKAGGPFATEGAAVGMYEVNLRSLWTSEADEHRARNLASVFDVDAPCIVATPYNSAWEMLPHPSTRAMSVCWVVEQTRRSGDMVIADLDDWKKAEDDLEQLRHQDHLASSELLDPSRQHDIYKFTSVPQIFADENTCYLELPDTPEVASTLREGNGPFNRYRVVDKVKGMWEIISMPYQLYTFF
ncbi:hypothetical protein BX600DRAFT_554323 [Xylariales sp. PMI_506]|nr:hypothetical protein BX600DRAFT_554323 [Xylariales sp. PMI_506]